MIKVCAAIFVFFSFYCSAQLQEVNDFGKNPGNLKMFLYVPQQLKNVKTSSIPLVVALHGCSQDAAEIAEQTGWNELADKFGFIVLYPEQKVSNNMTRCFNWFSKADIRFNGESASIYAMIQYTVQNYSIDPSRIFSYGLSAGGAINAGLLAQYPEVFNTGAVLAGGPYGVANNALEGFQLMKSDTDNYSAKELSDIVKQLHSTPKKFPKLIVLNGEEDRTVNPHCSELLVQQWLGLFEEVNMKPQAMQISSNKDYPNVEKMYYYHLENRPIVITYKMEGLGHSLPVNPGSGSEEGGKTGTYATDVDFFSTYFLAQDFGLIPSN